MVTALFAQAAPTAAAPSPALGVLVPHAGLVYSGAVAAAGWLRLAEGGPGSPSRTVVILGTNHSARFDGVAVYAAGAWRIPGRDVAVDGEVAAAILALGEPFASNLGAHRDEHSIEVQLPLLATAAPGAAIVPISVAAGTGVPALEAGRRLGGLLADLRHTGRDVRLAISTDMAHYPAHAETERVTSLLAPAICGLDPLGTAALERAATQSGARGMACGMCGIQPTVLGLAALREMGSTRGEVVAAATSADAGGPPDRTVGYLAVAFD